MDVYVSPIAEKWHRVEDITCHDVHDLPKKSSKIKSPKSDLKSKSQIKEMILNHDFKSVPSP